MNYENRLSRFQEAQAAYERECSHPGSRLACRSAALRRDDALDALRRTHEAVHGPVPEEWRPPREPGEHASDTVPPEPLSNLEGTREGRTGFWLEQSPRGGVSLLHRFDADEEPIEIGFVDAGGPVKEAPYVVEMLLGTSATAGIPGHREGDDDSIDERPEDGFEVIGRDLTRGEATMMIWRHRFSALTS